MQISLSKLHIFTAWLVLWLFVANVPTEASLPAYSHFLRMFAWSMVWMPLLLVSGIGLKGLAIFVMLGVVVYILILNLIPLKFDAVLMVANIVNAMFVASAYQDSRFTEQLLKALDLVLYVWAGLLIVQVSASLAIGTFVDFHSLFFPFSEARYFETGSNLYRLTGPHIEPGTYCGWTYGLVLLRCFLGGKILVLSTVIAMATVPLTLSVWGFVASGAFVISVLVYAVSRKEIIRTLSSLLVVIGMLFYFYGDQVLEIQTYLLTRAELADASGQSKEWAIAAFLRDFDSFVLIGNNLTYEFCPMCESPQDAGLGLNLIVYLGLVFTLSLVALVLRAANLKGGWALVVFSLPIFFSKYFVWETIFWLIVFLSLKLVLSFPTTRRHSNIPQYRSVIKI